MQVGDVLVESSLLPGSDIPDFQVVRATDNVLPVRSEQEAIHQPRVHVAVGRCWPAYVPHLDRRIV